MKKDVCSNGKALRAYQRLLADSRIDWASKKPPGLEEQWFDFAGDNRPSPKRWMDAYLAAFASCAGMTFVTFDPGFHQFPGVEVVVLPPLIGPVRPRR